MWLPLFGSVVTIECVWPRCPGALDEARDLPARVDAEHRRAARRLAAAEDHRLVDGAVLGEVVIVAPRGGRQRRPAVAADVVEQHAGIAVREHQAVQLREILKAPAATRAVRHRCRARPGLARDVVDLDAIGRVVGRLAEEEFTERGNDRIVIVGVREVAVPEAARGLGARPAVARLVVAQEFGVVRVSAADEQQLARDRIPGHVLAVVEDVVIAVVEQPGIEVLRGERDPLAGLQRRRCIGEGRGSRERCVACEHQGARDANQCLSVHPVSPPIPVSEPVCAGWPQHARPWQ